MFENFRIITQEPLPKFAVEVKFMSGDADAEEFVMSEFSTEEEVLAYIKEIKTFQKYQIDREFQIDKIAEALGWSEDFVQEYIWNVIPRDVTSDDYLAKLDTWKIFAYDNGIKYRLAVK